MRERNYQIPCHTIWYRLLLLTDVIHYLVTSVAYQRTQLLRIATVNRSPHQHSSRCWLEAPAGSPTKKLAATSGRRHWPICWCCLDRGLGSFDVKDAMTLCRVLSLSDCKYSLNPLNQTWIDYVSLNRIQCRLRSIWVVIWCMATIMRIVTYKIFINKQVKHYMNWQKGWHCIFYNTV